MAKGRRILIWTLGALALILLLGLFVSRLLLDEAHLKAMASDRAQALLGRQLDIGELSLRLLPTPALQARNIALSNPSWATNKHLFEAESITARLELLPLLKRQVAISSISIDGLILNLENADGKGKTWDIRNTSSDNTDDTGSPSPIGFNPFNLTSFQIKNALIHYAANSATPRQWQLEEFTANGDSGWRNVDLEGSVLRDSFPMKIKGRLADLSGISKQGAVSDGSLNFSWGAARLSLTGLLPLESSLQNQQIKAGFESTSLKDMLGFFGMPDKEAAKTAPIKASGILKEANGIIRIDQFDLRVGKLQASGEAQINRAGVKPVYQARLAVDRMDWAQTMQDIGRPSLPPLPLGELFRNEPFAWGLINFLQHAKGQIDLRINHLISRSGIELEGLKAKMDIDEQRLNVEAFSFAILNGTANGKLKLDGRKKMANLHLETDNLMLGQWLAARGSRLSMTGGPTRIRADVTASGTSMKDMAASLTGPVSISIGSAKLYSKKMQQAEGWLTGLFPVFSENNADHVNLACIGANFPFHAGRAEAEPIVGIRSDASQLLTTGYIDLKQETMDWRGKIRARSGVNLGISNIAGGDVRIAGPIAKPEIGLDPASAPEALARIGAAILTSGVSMIATAIWDAANPASDPCQITLKTRGAPKPMKKQAQDDSGNAG